MLADEIKDSIIYSKEADTITMTWRALHLQWIYKYWVLAIYEPQIAKGQMTAFLLLYQQITRWKKSVHTCFIYINQVTNSPSDLLFMVHWYSQTTLDFIKSDTAFDIFLKDLLLALDEDKKSLLRRYENDCLSFLHKAPLVWLDENVSVELADCPKVRLRIPLIAPYLFTYCSKLATETSLG